MSAAQTLRDYAVQLEHNIAMGNVVGSYPPDPVLPEVPINLRKAADDIERLEKNQAELVKALEYALERTWVDDSVNVYKSALEKAKS